MCTFLLWGMCAGMCGCMCACGLGAMCAGVCAHASAHRPHIHTFARTYQVMTNSAADTSHIHQVKQTGGRTYPRPQCAHACAHNNSCAHMPPIIIFVVQTQSTSCLCIDFRNAASITTSCGTTIASVAAVGASITITTDIKSLVQL